MELHYETVITKLEKLGLYQIGNILSSHLETAAKKDDTYLAFLNGILDAELEVRFTRYLKTRTKLARMPFHKTLEHFDFSAQPSVDERQIRELSTLSFISHGENVMLLGPPGVGKTHLAVALGHQAIAGGNSVYFTTVTDMVNTLTKATVEGRLERKLRVYTKPKLLILDEVGYLPLDRAGANLLFQVITRRYERGSIILTSNKSYGEWGEIFGDPVLATAILDRLVHHSVTISIRGDSYRLREKRKTGITPWQSSR